MEEIDFSEPVCLNQRNSKNVHRLLARFIDWIEQQSGEAGKYDHYIVRSGKFAYEIEHIWANHYERHDDEFDQQNDFHEYRNEIGGLLLLPKKKNASLNDMTYSKKHAHYLKENILAQSLNQECYKNNPGFLKAIKIHELSFKPYEDFRKNDLEERSQLYCQLASEIWSPKRLLKKE